MKKYLATFLLLVLVSLNVFPVFAFYDSQTDSLVNKIIQTKQPQDVSFGFITDLHYDEGDQEGKDSITGQLTALTEIANLAGLDFIMLGGDLYSGGYFKNSDLPVKEMLTKMLKPLENSEVPVFFLKGNHDDNSYYRSKNPDMDFVDEKLLDDSEYYALTNGRFQEGLFDTNYFYYDLKEKNTRIICLNVADFPPERNDDGSIVYAGSNYMGYSQKQLRWLVDTALSEPGLQYMIFSHAGTDIYEIEGREELNLIIKALNEQTLFTGLGTSRDFRGYQGLELYCSGHVHADKLSSYQEIGGAIAISVGCANIDYTPIEKTEGQNGYFKNTDRYYGLYSEALFDIVINQPDRVVCLRFGAGKDRSISRSGIQRYDESEQVGWWQENGVRSFYVAGQKHTGWLRDDSVWYFLGADGALKTGWFDDWSQWFYSDETGAMKTGWLEDGGSTYYLDENGAMKTGWLEIGDTWYYMNTNGAMNTGWVKEGETLYYLLENGIMATGQQTIDGRDSSFNANGAWLRYD